MVGRNGFQDRQTVAGSGGLAHAWSPAVRPFQRHSLHLLGVGGLVSPPFSFFLLLRELMSIHYSEVLVGCADFGTGSSTLVQSMGWCV